MLKNIVLSVSLLINGVAAYFVFRLPGLPSPKMTCAEARNEQLNKQATMAFASRNDMSLTRTHDYFRASDYQLRNIQSQEGSATFVYTADTYPSSCGTQIPGLDGSIIRIKINLGPEPRIVEVF